MAIVGINAADGVCLPATPTSNNAMDEISFICFKSIPTGTRLWFTDNGYERQFAGQWGTTEGVIQLQRTGTALAAGTVTTVRINGSGVVASISAGWTATNISGTMN